LNAYSELHEVRFYLLEPIYEYALEKLSDSGELSSVQVAHAHYYLSITEAAIALWHTPQSDQKMKQFTFELENIRSVLRWACNNGDLTVGLQLAGELMRVWRTLGYIGEGRNWLSELLSREHDTSDPTAYAARLKALHTAAWLAADEHDFAHAEQFIQQRIDLQRAAGETEAETDLYRNMALQARVVGDYQHSTQLLQQALAQDQAQGNRGSLSTGGFGFDLYLLALVMREQGDFGYAERLFKECVDFHEAIGERTGVAQGLLGLSDVARDQGDIVKTRAYGEQSLAILHEFRMQWAIGFALNNLAQAALMEGKLKEAFNLSDESVSLFRSLQADGSLAEVLVTLGHILSAQGELRAAQTALTESLRLAWIVGPRLMMVNGLEALAQVMVHTAQQRLAVQALSMASKLRLQMGTPVRPADQPMVEQTLASLHSSLDIPVFKDLWVKADERSLEAILAP
jgi:tetratricopeptide (TPR) repeat protein